MLVWEGPGWRWQCIQQMGDVCVCVWVVTCVRQVTHLATDDCLTLQEKDNLISINFVQEKNIPT